MDGKRLFGKVRIESGSDERTEKKEKKKRESIHTRSTAVNNRVLYLF